MKKILAHFLTSDLVIHQALKTHAITLEPELTVDQYFVKLCRDIVGQQLSVKVAEVIVNRFKALFPEGEITPTAVLAVPDEALRAVGLSWAKVKYIKDLAARVEQNTIPFASFLKLDDEAIIAELTKVKGIGRWTAEMFLMFTMARPDVFSKGDLGLRRGMQRLYGLSEDEWLQQVDEITDQWRPYRTYAAMAVWRSLDNQ